MMMIPLTVDDELRRHERIRIYWMPIYYGVLLGLNITWRHYSMNLVIVLNAQPVTNPWLRTDLLRFFENSLTTIKDGSWYCTWDLDCEDLKAFITPNTGMSHNDLPSRARWWLYSPTYGILLQLLLEFSYHHAPISCGVRLFHSPTSCIVSMI